MVLESVPLLLIVLRPWLEVRIAFPVLVSLIVPVLMILPTVLDKLVKMPNELRVEIIPLFVAVDPDPERETALDPVPG